MIDLTTALGGAAELCGKTATTVKIRPGLPGFFGKLFLPEKLRATVDKW
jgi:hypothetical protein